MKRDWLQIVSNFAILAGLAVLVYELEQGRNIATAQLTSEIYAYQLQQNVAMMGEDASSALEKACDEPTSLSTREKIILAGYYQSILDRTRRVTAIEANAGFNYLADEGMWHQVIESNFRVIFGTAYGRWWWTASPRRGASDYVKSVGNKVIAESGPIRCKEYYAGYDEWIRDIDL